MATFWKNQFIAASLIVRVESHVAACGSGMHDLTVLFPREEKDEPPDTVFAISSCPDSMTLTLDGEEVWQGSDAGEMVAAFEVSFYRRIIGELTSGLISMHAATVDVGGRRLTFSGASGAGKSSLCTRALLAGGTYFSDEFTILDESGCVVPFPRPLQWCGEKHPAFPMSEMMQSGLFRYATYSFPDNNEHTVTSLLWLPERVARTPSTLDVIVLPRYAPTAPSAEITLLNRSQALLEMSERLHHESSPIENIRLLHARIPLSSCFYRLVFSDVHAAWKALSEGGIIPQESAE